VSNKCILVKDLVHGNQHFLFCFLITGLAGGGGGDSRYHIDRDHKWVILLLWSHNVAVFLVIFYK